MQEKDIFIKLKPIIANYLPEDVVASDINLSADLTRELNINSAHLVDIILDVEDEFNIEFANADMEKLHTVQDAVNVIQAKTV